jgi:2-polyprenyl-3-methyl-5-hydroxy-6-metoxy-1,4-benzoquinol methylase
MTACPICKTVHATVIYDQLAAGAVHIVQCDHCSHIYTLQKEPCNQDELYADEVYEVVENRHSVFDKILNWEYGRVIKKIDGLKKEKGSLLDFGSGKGKFANLAQVQGWSVRCIETAPARADYAREVYGLDVDTQSYSGGKLFTREFDVLTFFHVVEHLSDPQDLLNELIKHNLAKGGLVVIEVPNIKSWQASLAGRRWMHLDIQRHISHFSSEQLEKIALKSGLVCKKTSYFSFHLGVLGMTDTVLKLLGYRRNIIYDLKNKRSIGLKMAIFFLLPFTTIFEFSSSMISRGGVIRKYFIFPQKSD